MKYSFEALLNCTVALGPRFAALLSVIVIAAIRARGKMSWPNFNPRN